MERFVKDPEAVLDYSFDWSNWLDSTSTPKETISTQTVTAPTGLTLDTSSITDGTNDAGTSMTDSVVQAWISGGTAGADPYRVECLITTSANRTDERSIWITVRER